MMGSEMEPRAEEVMDTEEKATPTEVIEEDQVRWHNSQIGRIRMRLIYFYWGISLHKSFMTAIMT